MEGCVGQFDHAECPASVRDDATAARIVSNRLHAPKSLRLGVIEDEIGQNVRATIWSPIETITLPE